LTHQKENHTMADRTAIGAVKLALTTPKFFRDVFGQLPAGDLVSQKAALRKQYAALAALVHPDRVAPSDQALAATVFTELTALRGRALSAIDAGTYEAPLQAPAAATAHWEVVSPLGGYAFSSEPLRTGDLSTLYVGHAKANPAEPLLAKLALEPRFNTLLEREAELLRIIQGAKVGSSHAALRPYFPSLVDTVQMPGPGNTRFRLTITRYDPTFVSVADVMAAYPKGLPPPEAAWIGRRIMAQALAARALGVTHGAITPDHVLVHPLSHEPRHIGWAHAVRNTRLLHVIDRWRALYPPEVFAKQIVDMRTDLYMAGATIVALLGGDGTAGTIPSSLPPALRTLLRRSLASSPADRPQDGQQFLSDFTRVVRLEWGRTYRPLQLPVSSRA
jgi:hypothetical protein